MIKFFRHIRQKLVTENRISKYLLYAIGEIVLVVIGILIALQINNANEAKNNEERLVKILKEIRHDIEIDVVTAQQNLKFGSQMDSLCNLVLNHKLTRQDYMERGDSDRLLFVGLQFNAFDFQKTGFNKFENFQGGIPERYEVLLKDINNYYNVTGKLHNDLYANFRQQIKDRHDYLANSTDWYYLLRKNETTPEMIDFYLNNPIYKNWVSQHKVDNTSGVYGTVNDFQNKGVALIYKLTDILQDNYEFNNKDVLEKLGESRTDLAEYTGSYIVNEGNVEIIMNDLGGYLFANEQWHLKTIEKDSFASTQFPDYRYSFKRNTVHGIIGIQMIHLKDSTLNTYWTKKSND